MAMVEVNFHQPVQLMLPGIDPSAEKVKLDWDTAITSGKSTATDILTADRRGIHHYDFTTDTWTYHRFSLWQRAMNYLLRP